MPAKRKQASDASPSHDPAPRSMDKRRPSISAKSYPRRRAAVACEVCRVRKTRCDAAKPACGFCIEIGVECQYRLPGDWDRPRAASPYASSEALERLKAKVARLEEKLETVMRNESAVVSQTSPSSHPSTNSHFLHSHDQMSPESAEQIVFHRPSFTASSRPLPEFSFRQTRGEASVARPSLITFHCPPFLNAAGWDDTELFYDDEMSAGEEIHRRLQTSNMLDLDLSRKTTRYLQQNFAENFLRWMPICSLQDCANYVNRAYACNFDPSDSSSCFALLVFAVGAVSEGKIGMIGEELPGLDYLVQGVKMLEGMTFMTRDLITLQCRLVAASYFQFTISPLQSWNFMSQISRDCMHMLSSSLPRTLDDDSREILHRIFWACSILLHELEAVVKMHPIGLRHFHDLVPLPLSRNQAEDLYYFLAQASLRKLLMETLDVVGYQKGQIIQAPIIMTELRHQIKEWYHHLPPPLRFPLDSTPLFDPRKSYLRVQYIGLFMIIGWPSVLQVLELSEAINSASLSPQQEQAQLCLSNCSLMISCSEENLSRRNLGSQLTLWALYVAVTTLILTHKAPELAFAPETKDYFIIRTGYEIFRAWGHFPVIRRGLIRTRNMMLAAAIPVDGLDDQPDGIDENFAG